MSDADDSEPDLEFDDEALAMMREDASKTLDRTLQKHDGHQKKAVQLIQVNGVVLSLLLAAGTQIRPNLSLLAAGVLFVGSALLSGYALIGTKVNIGLDPEQVTANIEAELDKNLYLRWYLEEFYYPAFNDLSDKTADRARRVRYSLYSFLGGLLMTVVGIVMQLHLQITINV